MIYIVYMYIHTYESSTVRKLANVATASILIHKIVGLFCRISSLL